METRKLDPRPHFWDWISKTEFPGPQSRDHGNQDFILNIMEAWSHFFNYRNRIKFFDITEPGLYFQYHGSLHRISEITEMAL